MLKDQGQRNLEVQGQQRGRGDNGIGGVGDHWGPEGPGRADGSEGPEGQGVPERTGIREAIGARGALS